MRLFYGDLRNHFERLYAFLIAANESSIEFHAVCSSRTSVHFYRIDTNAIDERWLIASTHQDRRTGHRLILVAHCCFKSDFYPADI